MKKKDDKTESGPTFYQTPNGKFLPSVYASALGRYYPYGGTFDMPRQQMYMPLDHVNANGGPIYPFNPLINTPQSVVYNNQRLNKGITTLPEIPIHPPQHRTGDSDLENVWEILDPSGFSSYNDVYDSYKKTGMSPETILEVMGALPVIGKFGKMVKGMKLGTDFLKEAKLSKALGVMDKIGKVSSANDVISPPSIELIEASKIGAKSKGGYLAPILPMHFDKGTQIYRDTTEIPNYRQGGKLMDFPAPSLSEREANINYNVYASMPGRYYNNGGMIKRADGSYSQRGLWDNIRANKGSGKEPTKEMLAQERKIRANEHAFGGNMIRTSHLFGMGGHKAVFFPTNVSEPGAADKDLTYPKDAYVYAKGGHLYPNGGTICPEGYFYDEETKSCQPILQKQEIIPDFKKDLTSPQLTLEELKIKHPDIYNRILKNKSLGHEGKKDEEEVLKKMFTNDKLFQENFPVILNPIYWQGLVNTLNTNLNNVKYYYPSEKTGNVEIDKHKYETITKIPDLPYTVKVDKSKAGQFDDKTKTLYVPSENDFHYKKFIEHSLLKKEQDILEKDLIKRGYKTDIKFTAETLNDLSYNNLMTPDHKYILDPYERFIEAKENETEFGSYENMRNIPEFYNYDTKDPYWLPAELKGQTYENFYKNRRKANRKRVEGTCTGCGYNHNVEYSYDNDYAYEGNSRNEKKLSKSDWEQLVNYDFNKSLKGSRRNTISSTQGVPPFPPEVMNVPTEKILPRNLVTPEASRKTQWKQNPITGTWYEDESYDSINNNTPWTDERPLGMESYNLNTGTYWTDEDAKKWQQQELKKQTEEAQKKSGQFNTITVPEGFANGGHLYDEGGGLITYKTHSKLINGTANFKAISKVDISPEYNEQIKHRLYTGNWGFDPKTGTLHLLKVKDRAVVGQDIRDIRAEEENVKGYNKSMEEAGGIDPRLMRPQTKMSQEEINNYIKEGHKAAINFLPFKLAAYATPWGAAAGTVEGAVNLIPDLYKGNYGAAAMDALMAAPAIGPGVRRIAYNAIEPAGYGVMQKIKDAPKTFVKNIMDPAGRPLRTGQLLTEGKNVPEEQMIEMGKNRLDSWRIGLRMPQKYDTFEEIGDNLYRIRNMKPEKGRLSAIDKDIKAYELSKKTGIKRAYDSSEIEYLENLENPEKHKEYSDELKKLFDEHDIIANPPSKDLTDINNIKRYLRKTGDLKTPPWQQTRIVEKSLQPEFKHSVYDMDPQGIMGSHRWDVRPHESGLLHYQSNDTWDLNPWESRGHTKVNPSQEEINILKRFYNKPLQNIEALSLIGGKPFQIQNNFAVDPKTFDVMGKWANGGHMSTTKTVFRTSELF
jgi:hypothetical protein